MLPHEHKNTVGDYSKRSDYLSNNNTRQFIQWLELKVDSPESLNHQYYLKKAKRHWSSSCLYEAYEKYWWPYNMGIPGTSEQMSGNSVTDSFKALTKLAKIFRASVRGINVDLASKCALTMLDWGGVRNKNKERLEGMGEKICDNFRQVQKRLNLSDVCLGNHDGIIINSGFTKLYFLLVDDFL